ncbi:MAG TPA: hypothetical protein VGO22_18175 [Pseudorhizobium sp.]|nr:hypothetical protein [Pseudorhizobium sp.]
MTSKVNGQEPYASGNVAVEGLHLAELIAGWNREIDLIGVYCGRRS